MGLRLRVNAKQRTPRRFLRAKIAHEAIFGADFHVTRGVLGTVQGIGGSSSQAVAGFIVTTAGYNAAFLTLAMVATAGLLLVVIAMPETTPSSKATHLEDAQA